MLSNTIDLNNGTKIPSVGLGTWEAQSPEEIASAIKIGYRHIDTASYYKNEEQIG